MKQTKLDKMKHRILTKIDAAESEQLIQRIDAEYENLCREDSNKSPDLIRHLHNNIYPVVATFRALMANGMPREEASNLAQKTFLELMEDPAASIRKLCRIPGVYRMVPWLFKKLMPKLFKKEAGFAFTFHSVGRGHCKFDMEVCPYYQTCQELNCPELAPVFCETDDICYGNMHPNLLWKRTQTIARGGDICDFDIQVKKPNL